MREVVIDETVDEPYRLWREAARGLLAGEVPPEQVAWRTVRGGEAGAQLDVLPLDAPTADALTADAATAGLVAPSAPRAGRVAVRRQFLALAERAACHADPDRWALLYRVLWRLTHGTPALLEDHADLDVARLARLDRAVSREVHKCHAFVRFRLVHDDAGEAYVAWFEPVHDVLGRAAPFFARRFPNMRWAILSPRRVVRWEHSALVVGPGVARDAAPTDDALEELWRTYYAHIFNPARVKVRAMRAEMAVRYWENLPEAALIPTLLRDAPARVRRMIAANENGEGRGKREEGAASADDDAPSPHAASVPAASVPAPASLFPLPSSLASRPALAIGTASWTDPTILEPGLFYPEGVRTPEARLRFYASRFPLVEVDSTYYALPTRRVAALWAERTPPGFTFDVKAHALLTGHPTEPKRLPRALRELLPPSLAGANRIEGAAVPAAVREAAWTLFLDALAPLAEAGKLGAILLQWPRDFRPTRAAADALAAARERLRPLDAAGVIGAVEFRHHEWYASRLQTRTLALLERLELAHVTVDGPQGFASSVPWVPTPTHPRLAVFRLHGRRGETWERPVSVVSERYRYLYDAKELGSFAGDIVDVALRTQGTHVLFNNCHADYGTRNAAEITELLRRRDAMRGLLAWERE